MRIAITSPAGKVDPGKVAGGKLFLESLGHEILEGETLRSEEFWTAGSADLRAAEFQSFWLNDEVDVVWAARGGFGCAHLLDLIDWTKMGTANKVLCGHSDISVFHLAFMKFGVSKSISASMPAVELAESKVDSLTEKSVFEAFQGLGPTAKEHISKCKILSPGLAKGRLLPVTLSVLCSICGTDYLPDLEGSVLVLEDVNEAPYRLDSYLNQLKLNGILSKISALIFADFNNCGDEGELHYIYNKYAGLIDGPVLCGLPFGHCFPRLSLPVGEFIELKVLENGIQL